MLPVRIPVASLVPITLLALAWGHLSTHPAAAASPTAIRFFVSTNAYGMTYDRELDGIIQEYNNLRPETRVELVRKGTEFSSAKELIAEAYTGAAPDLALIEPAETAALSAAKLAAGAPDSPTGSPAERPNSAKFFSQLSRLVGKGEPQLHLPHTWITLPFFRTYAVLVANQELLFRHYFDPHKLPARPEDLERAGQSLGNALPANDSSFALAIPFKGPRALWFFEAYAGLPLWTRTDGGLRANRELMPALMRLRKLAESKHALNARLDLEQTLDAFIGKRAVMAVLSTDLLPYLASRADFRWTAVPLPTPKARVASGSDLVVLRASPAIANFLTYLYSPRIAARLAAAGGVLPASGGWSQTPEWANAVGALPRRAEAWPKLVKAFAAKGGEKDRSADTEVIRARSHWGQMLEGLFGAEIAKDPNSLEKAFTAWDGLVARGSGP
ncbi:MAG: hypothetical protein AB7P04_12535 [Bacteriovoracia bacterium]